MAVKEPRTVLPLAAGAGPAGEAAAPRTTFDKRAERMRKADFCPWIAGDAKL
jgi:hypothetical protein